MKILPQLFMLTKMNKITLLIVAFILTVPVVAQETEHLPGTLITDRPDATESPNTVPVGYLQVETGAFFESFKTGNTKFEDFTLNTSLVRIGLLDNLELRLGWDFVESSLKVNGSKLDNVMSGFSPMLFGAKVNIANEKKGFPEIGLIGHVFLPFTAGKDYKPETTGIDFRFAFAHTLSENSSLSYNIGAQWGDDSPEASYVYTIAYGVGITDKLGAYAELYGDLPENHNANHFWDAGLTYLISDSVQLDATFGSSITEGQDILLSGGISFRIPTKKH